MAPRLLILLAALVVGALFLAGLFVPGRLGGVFLGVSDLGIIAVALHAEQRPAADAAPGTRVVDRRRPLRLLVVALVTALAAVKIIHG